MFLIFYFFLQTHITYFHSHFPPPTSVSILSLFVPPLNKVNCLLFSLSDSITYFSNIKLFLSFLYVLSLLFFFIFSLHSSSSRFFNNFLINLLKFPSDSRVSLIQTCSR